MNTVALRLTAAAALAAALFSAAVGLAWSPAAPVALGPSPVENEEPPLLTAEHRAVATFLASGRAGGGASGQGLFATDFFKPPPPPPPKPKPPAPTTREIPVLYRGLAAFPSGSVAFFSVDGKDRVVAVGETLSGGWALESFTADRARLVREEERRDLDARRPAKLVVPANQP